jgi:hypothetical protein
MEVADFPRHNKRMVRVGPNVTLCPLDKVETFTIPGGSD